MDNLNDFLSDLVQATGQTDPLLIKESVEELEPYLYDRLIVKLIERLSEKDQIEIQSMIEKDQIEELLEEIAKRTPDMEDSVASIIEEFAEEYLENTK
jgi:hypothetical protein